MTEPLSQSSDVVELAQLDPEAERLVVTIAMEDAALALEVEKRFLELLSLSRSLARELGEVKAERDGLT